MGNLIVAGALENSLCKFDLSSSHWIEAQVCFGRLLCRRQQRRTRSTSLLTCDAPSPSPFLRYRFRQPSYNMAVIAEFGHFACGEIMDAIRRQENDDEGDDDENPNWQSELQQDLNLCSNTGEPTQAYQSMVSVVMRLQQSHDVLFSSCCTLCATSGDPALSVRFILTGTRQRCHHA